MVAAKKPKPKAKPVIEYPPIPTKKWIPPDKRPKKPNPQLSYVKPEGISQRLERSTLTKVWHNFQIIGNKAILRGNFSETHKRFKDHAQGYQTSCNCIIATAFSKLFDMQTWNRAMVDKILELGLQLFLKSFQTLTNKAKRPLKLAEVGTFFFIDETKVTMTLKGTRLNGKVFADYDDTPYLKDVTKDFFSQADSGILSTQKKHFAIWKDGHAFYLYDPGDHNELGFAWQGLPGQGSAFVMRFPTSDALVEMVHENIDKKDNSKFGITPCSIMRMVKINNKPPDCFEETQIVKIQTSATDFAKGKAVSRLPQKNKAGEPVVEEAPEKTIKEQETMNAEYDEFCPIAASSRQTSRQTSQTSVASTTIRPKVIPRQVPQTRIPLERPRPENVSYFTGLIPKRMGILRASTHQCDPNFSKYKGKQSLPNAVSSIAMLRLHKAKNWIPKILDSVLTAGEYIYYDSMRALNGDQVLKPKTICEKITIKGIEFTPEIEEISAVGRLGSRKDDVLDLLPALQEFFRDHDSCIITGPITLSLWVEDGVFYMFDPNERDKNGMVIMRAIKMTSEEELPPKENGFACVTWYKELKDLVDVYMNNVGKAYRRDPFILHKTQIQDYNKLPDPWNNFQGLSRGKWILRGTFSQSDRRFAKETRNTQCTANATMAVAYSHLKEIKEWTSGTVDDVLVDGDTLYTSCVKYLKESNKFVHPMLMVDEINRKFSVGDKEISLEIVDCLVNGIINAKNENDVLNLKRGIEEFFRDNDGGVLTSRSISVALWKNDEVYYYYDSHNRNEMGIITGFGTACVLRVLNVDDLAKSIETNLGPGSQAQYNISRIGVTIWEQTEDGVVRPPLNNYKEVDSNKAILRSLHSDNSAIFKLDRGKQTIPMALVSLGMTRVYPSAIWSEELLDEILMLGNKLYLKSMEIKEKAAPELPEEEDIDEINSGNVIKEFTIGLNKIIVEFGDVREGTFEDDLKDKLEAHLNEEPTSDEDHREFLLESELVTLVVWKDNDVFYLFDPKPRDERGQVYGKDEWSAKIESVEEEPILDENEADEKNEAELDKEGSEGEDEGGERGAGDTGSQVSSRRSSAESAGRKSERDNEELEGEGEEELEKEEQEEEITVVPKHSEHYWAVQAGQGKACAMWFVSVDGLIEHILDNTPPAQREQTFKFLPVLISNKPEIKDVYDATITVVPPDNYAGDWYEFKEIEHGRWILKGTMDQVNEMFPERNRGKQTAANCFAMLAFAKLYALSKFKVSTIDSILKYGDRLYTSTRNMRKKQLLDNKELGLMEKEITLILDHETFDLEATLKSFCIGQNQVTLELVPNIVQGDIHAEDMEDVLDVKRGLEIFFDAKYRHGVLVAKDLTVAVFRGEKVYYMFDPFARGPSGLKSTIGTSCLTRYLSLEQLSKIFLKNLIVEGKNDFYIHAVALNVSPCPREPKPEEKPAPAPKLCGFVPLTPGKCILRGNISQEDGKFNKGANVLSAPAAIAALTMTLIHKCETWTKPVVDEILTIADDIYANTCGKLAYQFNPWEQTMTIQLLSKDYKMGVLKANCEVRNTDQRGVIDIKHEKILNLRQGIERFFEENTHGVIATDALTVAVWEDSEQPNLIYMFDPNPRGPAGMATMGGVACVLTFETAKLAADHFISNLDKKVRQGEFVITPVEIVVGNVKTKRKKKTSPKKDSTATGASGRTKKLSTSPSALQKSVIRKMADEERKRKEEQHRSKQSRLEYYVLPTGDAILRGTKSQTCHKYSKNSRGNQDIPNCITAFVVNRMAPVPSWNYKHLDMILDSGEQLYLDSYVTFNPKDLKLGLQNVMRRFYVKDILVSITIFKPVVTDVLEEEKLEMYLHSFFLQENFCFIGANDEWFSVFFMSGHYYLFDPHDRDNNGNKTTSGCACVMRFEEVRELVAKVCKNVASSGEAGQFVLSLAKIKEMKKTK